MNDTANDGLTVHERDVTAVLVLADGTVYGGSGIGRQGSVVGEVCFNTAVTGYQEILTDPSYAGQIITFTFPHIGNVGANDEDLEAERPAARGFIVRDEIRPPSNFRSRYHLDDWARSQNLVGIHGIDTRQLTRYIRINGAPNGVVSHQQDGRFDIQKLRKKASGWPGLEGMDLAKEVSTKKPYEFEQGLWQLDGGYGSQPPARHRVVAIDYGIKRNILRCLGHYGCEVTVVPCTASARDIFDLEPDGIFLSNGPGDPAATGEYAIPVLEELIESGLPIFGICLGHQLLALAAGADTYKMHQGHRGANHPVKDFNTNKVEITSMNHGFSVDAQNLPENVEVSHISLFDQTVCGLQWKDKPIFSVQHHPEASPGPQDSHYLFERFVRLMESA